jgi:hypothetical protein
MIQVKFLAEEANYQEELDSLEWRIDVALLFDCALRTRDARKSQEALKVKFVLLFLSK